MPQRSPIYERAVEKTMVGCGNEGYHSFYGSRLGYGRNYPNPFTKAVRAVSTEKPVFDVAAKITEIDVERAEKGIQPKPK